MKSKGGMYCDYCQRPVAGQKATHRMRNTASGVFALGTAGASLLGANVDGYHCPNCGQAVRKMTRADR